MAHSNPAHPTESIAIPPIPLVSGDRFTTEDGATHAIAAVTLTIQTEDGTVNAIPLNFRFGGWWVPTQHC